MRSTRRWLPVVVYTLAIAAASSMPAGKLPAGRLWNFDKLIHAAEYAVLAALWARALSVPGRSVAAAVGLAVGAALVTGCADELYQSFIPGRDSSTGDLLADGLGAIGGAIVAALYCKERNDAPDS